MSEFLHIDSVKLFMGHDSGAPGRLGRVLSENRRGVLLFDEVDKAHPLVWDLFLQMLDAARITLADHHTPFATVERAAMAKLHRAFRPELIGRFDEKIVFKPLSPDVQREIGRFAVYEELARLGQKGFDLALSEAAFEFIIRRGIHKTLGVRPLKRTVQKLIGDAVREALKRGENASGSLVVSASADRLIVS